MDPDDFFDDDLDYFYVEDSYDAADDLAEHAVPSPPPFEDGEEWDELSRFEYWVDIEYDSDGYNDVDERPSSLAAATQANSPTKARTGMKRKAEVQQHRRVIGKRRRTLQSSEGDYVDVVARCELARPPTVRWLSAQDKALKPMVPLVHNSGDVAGSSGSGSDSDKGKPFALLKDWKVRFADSEEPSTPPSEQPTPQGDASVPHSEETINTEETQENGNSIHANVETLDFIPEPVEASLVEDPQAALAKNNATKSTKKPAGKSAAKPDKKHAPVSNGRAGDDAGLGELFASSSLDPNTLRAVLEANLAASGGAPGLDVDTLLTYAMRMLGGGEEADDIADDLARQLLGDGEIAEDDDQSIEGEYEEEDDDEGPANEIGLSAWVARQKAHQNEPRDLTELHKDCATDLTMSELPPAASIPSDDEKQTPLEPATKRASKRKADDSSVAESSIPRPKREKKGYEMPTANSKARINGRPTSNGSTAATSASKATTKAKK